MGISQSIALECSLSYMILIEFKIILMLHDLDLMQYTYIHTYVHTSHAVHTHTYTYL